MNGVESAPGICDATQTPPVAKTPRICGFPKLTEATGFTNDMQITAGLSIAAESLQPNKLYSVSMYCFVSNCEAEANGAEGARRRLLSMNNGSRRLLSTDEHDVVVNENNEYDVPLTAAAGVHLLQVQGEFSTTPAPSSVSLLFLVPIRLNPNCFVVHRIRQHPLDGLLPFLFLADCS